MPPAILLGDCVEFGVYHLHSAFSDVQNFVREGSLVSLVSPRIGFSGSNIVWHRSIATLPKFARLELGKSGVAFDGVFQNVETCMCKTAWAPSRQTVARTVFAKACELLPRAGFSFLLNDAVSPKFVGFEAALAIAAVEAQNCFRDKKLEQATRLMRGLGIGLTPSGDDYLCGVLCAYSLVENAKVRDTAWERGVILENALGDNVLSNAFLRLAAKGSFSVRQMNFFEAMFSDDGKNLEECVKDVCGVGETSGVDYLAGFLRTIESECLA